MGVLPLEHADWVCQQEGYPAEKSSAAMLELESKLSTECQRLLADELAISMHAETELDPYVQRAWKCIEFHWHKFAQDGNVKADIVIQRIREGTLAYGQVAEYVLSDVLIAQGLELNQDKAAEVFERDYMPNVRAVAHRAGGASAADRFDNLAADLILPRPGHPPRIATYLGKTPLKSWLRTVVINLWVSHIRSNRERPGNEMIESQAAPDDCNVGEQEQCEDLLRPMFQSAVNGLELQDRLLLKMLVLDGAPQNQLARTLGINPGTVTRRRQRASQNVFTTIRQLGADSDKPEAVQDCLDLVLASESLHLRHRLGDLLAASISETETEDKEGRS
jgi:RNA polymerase sigma factor (sigma-70 family)